MDKGIIHNYPNLKPIEYLEASAGWGKTYSTLTHVVNNEIPKGNSKWVYVGKSKHLIKESRQLCESLNDNYIYKTIDSDNKEKPSNKVVDEISNFLLSDSTFDILFMTHTSFLMLIAEYNSLGFSGCNILIDEALDIIDIQDITFKNKKDDILHQYMKEQDDGTYKFTNTKTFIDRCKVSGNYTKRWIDTVTTLSYPNTTIYKISDNKQISYLYYHVYDLRQVLLVCNRFIILGAELNNTLNSVVLQHMGIRYVEYADVTLSRTKYHNQQRISVYYLVKENTSKNFYRECTSTLLEGLWDYEEHKYISRNTWMSNPNGRYDYPTCRTVFEQLLLTANTLLEDNFIYTVNKKRKELAEEVLEGGDILNVDYGCYGWNNLQHYTKALCLFTYKPNIERDKLLSILSEIYKCEDIKDKYIDLKMRAASYQMCTRTGLRNFNNLTQEIMIVVPDKPTAEYIVVNHIPDAIIKSDIAMEFPKATVYNGGHNKSEFNIKYQVVDNKEKSSISSYIHRYKKKHGVDPTEETLYNYLTKYRNKRNIK